MKQAELSWARMKFFEVKKKIWGKNNFLKGDKKQERITFHRGADLMDQTNLKRNQEAGSKTHTSTRVLWIN